MTTQTTEQLKQKKCEPCEGGVDKIQSREAKQQIKELNGWELTDDAGWLRKKWIVKDFMAAINFFEKVAKLAEEEGHHPDLHLKGYRNVIVEISTHAIGGLSENDFILAAKIDDLPIELKKN